MQLPELPPPQPLRYLPSSQVLQVTAAWTVYVQSGDTYTPLLEPVAHTPRTVTDPLLGTVYVHIEFALHRLPVASIMYCPLCPDRLMVMVAPAVSEPPQATEPSLAEPAEDC